MSHGKKDGNMLKIMYLNDWLKGGNSSEPEADFGRKGDAHLNQQQMEAEEKKKE